MPWPAPSPCWPTPTSPSRAPSSGPRASCSKSWSPGSAAWPDVALRRRERARDRRRGRPDHHGDLLEVLEHDRRRVPRELLSAHEHLVRLVRRAVAADAVGVEPHAPLGEQLAEVDLALLVV